MKIKAAPALERQKKEAILMKKLALILTFAMLLSMCAFTGSAEGAYNEAPMLAQRVEAGELPPVEERLPENPRIAHEILDEYLDYECGNYAAAPCG